jgi:hypothetical protein
VSTTLPRGTAFRLGLAKKRPQDPILKPCDLAALLSLHTSTIRRKPITCVKIKGGKGNVTRRYSWAAYLDFMRETA